jgi:branched-chain amino acid transport system ATP-binding protein
VSGAAASRSATPGSSSEGPAANPAARAAGSGPAAAGIGTTASRSPTAASDAPLLRVAHLSKAFGGLRAVADVSFDLQAGEMLALIGPNGAGKTTCFNMVNGQLKPDAGSVRLAGTELVGLRPDRIWRLGVGRTFQIAETFASLTVIENVQLALLSHAGRIHGAWRSARRQFRDEALALLAGVHMEAQAERAMSVLAYGDVKRVELAIALANEPRLLLMDEPTAGMGPAERNDLMALTRNVARQRGIGVLFTEHSMDVVFAHADRMIVLARGKLIAAGEPAVVRDDPHVREVYFGMGTTFGQTVSAGSVPSQGADTRAAGADAGTGAAGGAVGVMPPAGPSSSGGNAAPATGTRAREDA